MKGNQQYFPVVLFPERSNAAGLSSMNRFDGKLPGNLNTFCFLFFSRGGGGAVADCLLVCKASKYSRNRKSYPCFHKVMVTRVEVGGSPKLSRVLS